MQQELHQNNFLLPKNSLFVVTEFERLRLRKNFKIHIGNKYAQARIMLPPDALK